uniref:Si:dkey-202b22.6 n=1 Tax=Astyanax mexicanus TaxID=7994 RepID=A0A3B1IXV0_ASTMX
EQYVVPDPPAALIRMPQTTQPKQLVSDLYPWTTVDTQQLCIQWYRLKTLHDQLISVCIEVKEDSALSASPASSTTSSISSQKKIRSSSKSLDKFETLPQRQMLLEKTKHTCTEIRNLLKPELKSHPVTEVPFEPSVQTLCDLERCFNPTTGAILKDKVLIDWLFSLLL